MMPDRRDPGGDPEVSRRYRELGAEAPPVALDEAILAASRRTAHAGLRRPPRSATRRWGLPLSLAAVVVLSVTVTLNLQQEQPGIEQPRTAPPKLESAAPAPKPADSQGRADALRARVEIAKAAEETAKRAAGSQPGRFTPDPPARRPEPPAPAEAPAARAQAAPMTEDRALRDQAASERSREAAPALSRPAPDAARNATGPARAESLAKQMAETPEKELERIAALRREDRHDEADKALAEFRKRYPDYRIPEAMLEKVERR